MNMNNNQNSNDIESLFKTLSHPARIAILQELRNGEHCVCHFEAVLGLRQAYISQQLAVLRENGLISDRRDGWNVYYSVKDKKLFHLLEMAYEMMGKKPNKRVMSTNCPCPHCNSTIEKDEQENEYQSAGLGLREL